MQLIVSILILALPFHPPCRSIIQHFGGGDPGQSFPRLKIGIGRPAGQLPVHEYVLQPFRKTEQPEMDKAVADSLAIVKSVLALGLDRALSGVRV